MHQGMQTHTEPVHIMCAQQDLHTLHAVCRGPTRGPYEMFSVVPQCGVPGTAMATSDMVV